jgi:hypothetical protein
VQQQVAVNPRTDRFARRDRRHSRPKQTAHTTLDSLLPLNAGSTIRGRQRRDISGQRRALACGQVQAGGT